MLKCNLYLNTKTKHTLNSQIKKHLLNIVRISLLIYFIYWLFKLLNEDNKIIENFHSLSIVQVIYLLTIYIVSTSFSNLQFLTFLNKLISFKESYSLNAYNSFLNLILPLKSGLAYRGFYLNKYYTVPWKQYISLSLVSQMFLLISPLVIIYFWGLFKVLNEFNFVIASIVSIGMFFCISKISFDKLQFIEMSALKSSKSILIILAYSISFNFIWAYLLYCCFNFIGFNYSFISVLILQSLLMFSGLLNITPGNIGVKEGAAYLISGFLGIDGEHAVAALLVERSIYTIAIILGGLLAKSHLNYIKKLK